MILPQMCGECRNSRSDGYVFVVSEHKEKPVGHTESRLSYLCDACRIKLLGTPWASVSRLSRKGRMIMSEPPKKVLIKPDKVMALFECPYCKYKSGIPIKKLHSTTFVCDECNNMENYMELKGILIKEE